MDVGERIADVELRTADGEPVLISQYLDRPTVIQLARYYG